MQSILSALLLLTSGIAGYQLPNPSGKYNVTLATGPLTDYARNDTYATPPAPRELMLSVFRPTLCEVTVPVPYMPNKTAEYQGPFLQRGFDVSANLSPLFLQAELPVCSELSVRCTHQDDAPILLFSPGLSIPRLYYSVLASVIASEGFMVITIDHPSDANIITYPDGHTVFLNDSFFQDPTLDVYPRAADASFVIDQLANATAVASLLPDRGPRPFPTSRIGILGHSLGGSTAVIALGQDPRLCAAINWDGTIFGSVPPSGLSQPVMLVSQPSHTNDSTWTTTWAKSNGPKIWLNVANATHQTFSDLPTMLQAAGVDAAPYADLLGTIAPAHMVRLLAAYTAAWMNGAFEGDLGNQPLLREGRESAAFPEVSIVMKDNF